MKLNEAKEKLKIAGPAQAGHIAAMINQHYEEKFFGLCNTLTRLAEKVKRANLIVESKGKLVSEDWIELRNSQEEAFSVLEDAKEVSGI